ncbi:MAG: tetratricopeptide repeat protein, partial [Leptospiraceae bacterium]|nr:tetratricopeptide repeat protein [Leptospiraceae bacterium]
LNAEHRVPSLELAKELKEKKRFFLAAQVLEKHITWFPFSDNEFHATAYSYKMARQYTKAIQISEALLIRNPEHVKNLINLTDCLIKTNNFKRAAIITERGLIIDPENEKLNLLQKKLHDLKEPNV